MAEDELNKANAQRRADRVRAFRDELEQIERDGALSLSGEQRGRLSAYHDRLLADLHQRFDVDTSDTLRQMSWGMRIASTLGALALSSAVYLFFYRFWGEMATPLQVVLLVAAPLLCVVAMQWCSLRERTPYFTALFGMLALACFILDLNVLGAIFNLRPTPQTLLAWGLFALILAYAHRLRLLLAAGLVLLMGYATALFGSWYGPHWAFIWQRPENYLLAGSVVFLVPLLRPQRDGTDFAPVYRLLGELTVFLSLFVLSVWGAGSRLPLGADFVEVAYRLVGLLLAGLAIWVGIRRDWREVAAVGYVFLVGHLYWQLFDWWWDWMPRYLFFLILGLIAVALLAVLRWFRKAHGEVV